MVVYNCQNSLNIHLRAVHFIVCELHYNTVDLNRKTGEDFHVWVG